MEDKTVLFETPSFHHKNNEIPSIARDHDSVSIFQSRYPESSEMKIVMKKWKKPNLICKGTTMDTSTSTTVEGSHVTEDAIHVYKQEPKISLTSENDSRISLPQHYINAIASSFTVALEGLATQASVKDEY